jgi:hypothetical protein
VAIDQTIVATAIPAISDHFHALNDVGWYASAFFLTAYVFILTTLTIELPYNLHLGNCIKSST